MQITVVQSGASCPIELIVKVREAYNNFSIFMIRVKSPTTLNKKQARGIDLHLLETSKDNNKNFMEIIQASKNIRLPTNIKDLLTII